MKRRSPTSSRPRRALTLVEVLAGAALLGTLMVGILLASGRLGRQSVRAERKLQACRIAEAVLDETFEAGELPRHGGGDVPGEPGWRWRTRVTPRRGAETLEAEVVVFELLGPPDPHAAAMDEPAVTVELLMPKETPDATGRLDAD